MKARSIRPPSVEDQWTRRAIAAAVHAARTAVLDGTVMARTPIIALTEPQWTRLAAATIAGWVCARAEQASAVGLAHDELILTTGHEPEPWDLGVVTTVMPELYRRVASKVDLFKGIGQLSRPEMIALLADAMVLLRQATAARDRGLRMTTERAPDDSKTQGGAYGF
jgi:hypothetical protein